MKNTKIETSFENRILSVRFLENAIINSDDLKEIYDFGNSKASGKPYCVIFEAAGHYEVTDDALEYMENNPNNKNVLAKAYVTNTKESERKTKLHLLFDHPSLKPFTFPTKEEAMNWLRSDLKE